MTASTSPFQFLHFWRPFVFIAAIVLLNCCCFYSVGADDEEVHLEKFACAKANAQLVDGLTIEQGNRINITKEAVESGEQLALLLWNGAPGGQDEFVITLTSVKCKDNNVKFSTSISSEANSTKTKCDMSTIKDESFNVTCHFQMSRVANVPAARAFKIRLTDLIKLDTCDEGWKAGIEGVRLLLTDPKDANGEPCQEDSSDDLKWAFIIVFAISFLLKIAVLVLIVLRIRMRRRCSRVAINENEAMTTSDPEEQKLPVEPAMTTTDPEEQKLSAVEPAEESDDEPKTGGTASKNGESDDA